MNMLTYSYGAKAPTQNAETVDRQLSLTHRYHNRLVSLEKDRRVVQDTLDKEDKEGRDELRLRANALTRAYRAACGVYWGTYLVTEAAVQAASRTREGPRFHRWDWRGTVAVQIINGMPAAQLMSGNDTRARVVGSGKHRELWLRVGSDGRDPVWAIFPMVWHRDLPPSAVIKWVKCVRRKVATKTKWSAQFSIAVDAADMALPAPTKDAVGLDIGWRVRPDGIRAAYWYDGKGSGELVIPSRIIQRYHKPEDLRSIRDKAFNIARDNLSTARKEYSATWPEWLAVRTQTLHAWRSTAKLAALCNTWRARRFDGDDTCFAPLEDWRKQDKHLYEWEGHQRENVLRARREIYRLFARKMAGYKHVVIEDIDLRRFAVLPDKGEKEPHVTTAARPNRFRSSLSELLACIVQAGKRAGAIVSEAPAEYTTQECSWCGHTEAFDAAKELEHTCSGCHKRWDQDLNAARNLYRAAEWCKEPGRRSRAKSVDETTGKTKAELRREKGIATRRAAARNSKEKMNESGALV